MKKKHIITLILFLGCCSFLKSQDKIVDSLLLLLKTNIHDTTKLNVLVSISDVCSEEEIQKYSLQALKFSKKLYSSTDKKIKALAQKKWLML